MNSKEATLASSGSLNASMYHPQTNVQMRLFRQRSMPAVRQRSKAAPAPSIMLTTPQFEALERKSTTKQRQQLREPTTSAQEPVQHADAPLPKQLPRASPSQRLTKSRNREAAMQQKHVVRGIGVRVDSRENVFGNESSIDQFGNGERKKERKQAAMPTHDVQESNGSPHKRSLRDTSSIRDRGMFSGVFNIYLFIFFRVGCCPVNFEICFKQSPLSSHRQIQCFTELETDIFLDMLGDGGGGEMGMVDAESKHSEHRSAYTVGCANVRFLDPALSGKNVQ